MIFILFDIDGTLIHSGGAGARALNLAFKEKYGIDEAMSVVNPHGQTDVAIVEEIFRKKLHRVPDEEEIQQILETYLFYLRKEVWKAEKYKVLEGVVETLDALHTSKGFFLGLATGNIEKGARIKLERGDLNKYFLCGGFGSDHRERWQIVKKAYERCVECAVEVPSSVYVVGDTPLDVEAGKKAGFKTVGVATSIYTVEDLKRSGADFVINNMLELLNILEKDASLLLKK
ncbi:MAG: HAD family hydrolase [bacterium]|nr:HAD family hydrolase [bacterium]